MILIKMMMMMMTVVDKATVLVLVLFLMLMPILPPLNVASGRVGWNCSSSCDDSEGPMISVCDLVVVFVVAIIQIIIIIVIIICSSRSIMRWRDRNGILMHG
jgi:hypothetical protein